MMPCRMTCTNVSEQCAACTFSTVAVSIMFHKTLHHHQHRCQNVHCHRLLISCLPSRILIFLTPFSIRVLAAARPAMPAPTIITWHKFVRSSTGTLAIWQLQQFRYKCNVRHRLSYRHRVQEAVQDCYRNQNFLKSLLSAEIQVAICNSVHITY